MWTTRLFRLALAPAAAYAFLTLVSPAATALETGPIDVVLVNDTAELNRKDGPDEFSITLINLTNQPLTVGPAHSPDGLGADCRPQITDPTLAPGRQDTVTVRLTGCTDPKADSFTTVLTAGSRSALPITVDASETDPKWATLQAFGWAALASVVLAVAIGISWKGTGTSCGLWSPLAHLKDGWKFNDSWATNLTVFATAITGLFGASDVLNALGQDTDAVLSLVLVAGAVGTALTGAGPLLVQATRRGRVVTPIGVLSGAVATLTGTGGLLFTAVFAAQDLDLGGFEDNWLLGLGTAGALLLVGYAIQTLWHALTEGSTPLLEPRDGNALTQESPHLRTAANAIRDYMQEEEATADQALAKVFPTISRSLRPPNDEDTPMSPIL
ncbi:hypothetical protein [Streptomyces sp. NPDC059076]|uniref:hypothetical protein n=1 Tax=unclassified Streptomyces TaxID=2593676 RepID=UPI0036A8DBD2